MSAVSPRVLAPQIMAMQTWEGHAPVGLPEGEDAYTISIDYCTVSELMAFIELAEVVTGHRPVPLPRRIIRLGQASLALSRRLDAQTLLAVVRAAVLRDPVDALQALDVQGLFSEAPVYHKTFAQWDRVFGQYTGNFVSDAHLVLRVTGEQVVRRCVHWAEYWPRAPTEEEARRMCALALLRALASHDDPPPPATPRPPRSRSPPQTATSVVQVEEDEAAADAVEGSPLGPAAGLVALLPRAWEEYERLLGRAAQLRLQRHMSEEKRLMGVLRRLGLELGSRVQGGVNGHGKGGRTSPGGPITAYTREARPLRRSSSCPRQRPSHQRQLGSLRPPSPRPGSPRRPSTHPTALSSSSNNLYPMHEASQSQPMGLATAGSNTRGQPLPVAAGRLGDLGTLSFDLPTLAWTGELRAAFELPTSTSVVTQVL